MNNYTTISINEDNKVVYPKVLNIPEVKTDKFQIANHAIFGVDYKNPDDLEDKDVPISTELKGWYFASKIEEVPNKDNTYRVALSDSPNQKGAFTNTTKLATISVDDKYITGSTLLSGLTDGDKISMKNHFSINNLLTVEQIDGNVLTYKFDKDNSPNPTTTNCATGKQYRTPLTAGNPARVKECSIWCIEKPEIGIADLSQYNAIVGGSGCKVYGINGFASGEKNKVIDDYGAAFGRSNTVGYCCFSTGQRNNSTGCEYAATIGANLTTINNYQVLVGYNIEAEKDTVFAVRGRNTSTNIKRTSAIDENGNWLYINNNKPSTTKPSTNTYSMSTIIVETPPLLDIHDNHTYINSPITIVSSPYNTISSKFHGIVLGGGAFDYAKGSTSDTINGATNFNILSGGGSNIVQGYNNVLSSTNNVAISYNIIHGKDNLVNHEDVVFMVNIYKLEITIKQLLVDITKLLVVEQHLLLVVVMVPQIEKIF